MSGEDLWALAFSNIGRMGGHRKTNDDVSRAIHAISGIAPHSRWSEATTGAQKSMAL